MRKVMTDYKSLQHLDTYVACGKQTDSQLHSLQLARLYQYGIWGWAPGQGSMLVVSGQHKGNLHKLNINKT